MKSHLYTFGSRHINFTVHASVELSFLTVFKCPVCKRERKDYLFAPSEGWIVRPQKKWPDILPCTGAGTAVSLKVADDMAASGITGYRLHRLALVDYPPEKAPTTEYHLLEPTGGATFTISQDSGIEVCPHCGMWDSTGTPGKWDTFPDISLMHGSWDGADWVRATAETSRFSCCSERVVDLAAEKQWTNAAFGVVSNRLLRGISFDAADKNWRETVNARIAYEVTRRVKPGQ